MNTRACLAGILLLPSTVLAGERLLSCEMQTTFHKPYVHDTEWVHRENAYTKFFRIDTAGRMAYVLDERSGRLKPVCQPANTACTVQWTAARIHIDASHAPDEATPPYLDFRRTLTLDHDYSHAVLVIGDYGQSTDGRPNLYWRYEGTCRKVAQLPVIAVRTPGMMGAPGKHNPAYEEGGPALPVTSAERDRALAGYYGNTMAGFSGGGHWFHMWFLDRTGLAYTGDDKDISGEAQVTQWYIGRDRVGYRICREPIPAEGRRGCYPILVKQPGESWVEHDMDGDAFFTLLPGRQ